MTITKTNLEEVQQQRVKSLSEQRSDYQKSLTQDHELLKTKKDWKLKLFDMFAGSEFANHEEIPEEVRSEKLQDATGFMSGRKIGTMEMIKAKREYRRKRETAKARLKVVNDYTEKINQEDLEISGKEAHAFRDEWHLLSVLDTKEERQSFMDDYLSGEKERELKAMEKAIDKLKNLDLSIFKVKNEDDMYKNYEEKMRYIDMGFICRSMLLKYHTLGGAMDDTTFVDLQTRCDFLEQQSIFYRNTTFLSLHPQNILLRDKDLENMTPEQLFEKQTALTNTIKQKEEAGETGPELNRLKNLKSFVMELYLEKQERKTNPMFGVDPEERFQELKEKRLEQNRKQWAYNFKGILKADLERGERGTKLMPPEIFKVSLQQAKIWSGAGVMDRVNTHMSITELVYLHKKGKQISDVEDPKNQKELEEIRDEVEKVLHNQNTEDLADLLADMVKGFIRQFSVVDGKAVYEQFLGVSSMRATIGKVTALNREWVQKAKTNLHLGALGTDIVQLALLDKDVTQLAFSKLSKEEIELYRKALFYTDNVGGVLTTMVSSLKSTEVDDPKGSIEESTGAKKKVKLDDPENITPETVAKIVDANVKNDDMAHAMQGYIYYLETYAGEETKLKNGAYKTIKKDLTDETGTPNADQWELELGGGLYQKLSMYVDVDSSQDIYNYLRSGEGLEFEKLILDEMVNTDTLFYYDKKIGNITLNQDGKVDPPA